MVAATQKKGTLQRANPLPWKFGRKPLETFNSNIQRAQSLYRMHYYITDLVETGGKQSLGRFQRLSVGMVSSLGVFTPADIDEFVETKIDAAAQRITEPGAKRLLKKMEKSIEELKPLLEEAQHLFGQVYDGVLLEQAIVAGASAIEIYFEDALVDLIQRNRPTLEQLYEGKIQGGLRYRHLLRSSESLERAYAMAILDSESPSRFAKRLALLTQHMTNGSVTVATADANTIDRLVEQRNLIVHRGGFVNSNYRGRFKTKAPLGARLDLSLKQVETQLSLVKRVVEGLDGQIRSAPRHVDQRAFPVEYAPPRTN